MSYSNRYFNKKEYKEQQLKADMCLLADVNKKIDKIRNKNSEVNSYIFSGINVIAMSIYIFKSVEMAKFGILASTPSIMIILSLFLLEISIIQNSEWLTSNIKLLSITIATQFINLIIFKLFLFLLG